MKVNLDDYLFDTEDILMVSKIRELHSEQGHEFRFSIEFKGTRGHSYTHSCEICNDSVWKRMTEEERRKAAAIQEALIKQIHQDLEWAMAYGHGGSRKLPLTN